MLPATLLALSVLVTKAVDLVRNTFDKGNRAPKWAWQLVAFAFGILAAVMYRQADVSQVPGLPPIFEGATGTGAYIIVGLAIGAAASGFHELFDALSGVAKRGRSNPPL